MSAKILKRQESKDISSSLTSRDLALIFKLHLDGVKRFDIAKRFGYSSSNPISDILKSYGHIDSKIPRCLHEALIKDYLSGKHTLMSLTRKYEVRVPDIKNILFTHNVPLMEYADACKLGKLKLSGKSYSLCKSSEKIFKSSLLEAVSLYLSGTSLRQVAFKYSVAIAVVKKTFIKNRVVLRGHAESKLVASLNCEKRTRSMISDIRKLTGIVYDRFSDIINPNNLPRGKFLNHLDHLYPASRINKSSVRHPANIWEICHPANLRLIPCKENLKKHAKLVITRTQLRQRISAWNLKYIDPYYACLGTHHTKLIRERHGIYDSWGKLGNSSKRRYYQTSNCAQREVRI